MTDQTTTEPTSVGLTADQVLVLLATWLREQGLKARSMSQMVRDNGQWIASFSIADEDNVDWAHALGCGFRVATAAPEWWLALDLGSRPYPRIDGISLTVYGEHHDGPIPPEFAAGAATGLLTSLGLIPEES